MPMRCGYRAVELMSTTTSITMKSRACSWHSTHRLILIPIGDKLAFHELCKAQALPTPAVLAVFAPNTKLLEFEAGASKTPAHDLFVKPSLGVAGDGAERFYWRGVGFENDHGCRLRREDLDGYLASRAHRENRTLLVQPLLRSHTDFNAESNGALATARLVTGRSADGEICPSLAFSILRYSTARMSGTAGMLRG